MIDFCIGPDIIGEQVIVLFGMGSGVMIETDPNDGSNHPYQSGTISKQQAIALRNLINKALGESSCSINCAVCAPIKTPLPHDP